MARSNRRRGYKVAGWALVAALACVGLWTLWAVASGRTTAPFTGGREADQALADARNAGASRWVPQRLADAESRLREAQLENRRQGSRLMPLRDYERARVLFRESTALATLALEEARTRVAGASTDAARRAARAHCLVGRAEGLMRGVPLGGDESNSLKAARLHADEAQLLATGGDHDRALRRADEAIEELRRVMASVRATIARFVDPAEVRRWDEMRQQTIAASRKSAGVAIVVNKDEGTLTLYDRGRPARSLSIELGLDPLSRKLRAGDRATPEGRYRVSQKKGRGRTKYYKALEIDYPNGDDRRRLKQAIAERRVPAGTAPGSLIQIHGEGGRGWDWTHGCVAVTNREMDDLFERVPEGAPVTIVGGDGNGGRFSNLARSLVWTELEDACVDD